MSSNISKKYTAEFKDEAVKKARNIGVYKTSKELGVSTGSLYKWLSDAGYPASPENTLSAKADNNPFKLMEENKQLKKENARLKEEREILKKATTFFAKLEK